MSRNKNNKSFKVAIGLASVALMGVIILGVTMFGKNAVEEPESSSLPTVEVESSSSSSETTPTETRVSLYAVGDNLYHESVIIDGDTVEDYLAYYAPIAEDISSADIAFVNQETVIGGADLGIGGYPIFNSPDNTGIALVELGFDVVNQSSNHTMDKGTAGIDGTMEFWANYPEVLMIGMYDSWEDRDSVKIVEREGIRFAFLSYTYGLNGYTLPSGEEYRTNLIETELIRSDIRRAKTQSDVVIVSMHWGTEYSTGITASQENLAQMMADEGVDLVLGHHPHVIAPVQWIAGESGNQMLIYYSLGNLVHSMEVTNCMLGAAAKVEFVQDSTGEVSIATGEAVPIINHYEEGKKGFVVYPLDQYPEELAARHGIKNFDRPMDIAEMMTMSSNILGGFYGTPQTPPVGGETSEPVISTPVDSSSTVASSAASSTASSSSSTATGAVDNGDWRLALLNKSHGISAEYPVELTLISGNYDVPARSNMSVDSRIVDPLLQMFADAKEEGINLYLRSAHRTYALQQTYWTSTYTSWINAGKSKEEAERLTGEYLAFPGTSEHHTGLAVDLTTVEWEDTIVTLSDAFEDTEAFTWLDAHAHEYGFILRYMKDKVDITGYGYEPWHYRYVGVEVATEIKNAGICLEEYLGILD